MFNKIVSTAVTLWANRDKMRGFLDKAIKIIDLLDGKQDWVKKEEK